VSVPSRGPAGLSFKAYEIEEIADVYFFRPLGMVCAKAARALRLTPVAVTAIGALVGMAGGAMLYSAPLALAGFALIIVHGILDSSDGQLARMTGQVSELGRVLDGAGGYLTHASIYIAILLSVRARGGDGAGLVVALAAALSNIVHAQMYDYHRTTYLDIAIRGKVSPSEPPPDVRRGDSRIPAAHAIVLAYQAMQRAVAGRHREVERFVAARAENGAVREDDRARYRRSFYAPVRGWNLMGDNTRFYAIGVLALTHRLDWFFTFVAVPMNLAFVLLWMWQARADRRFLAL
jgi:phosphatidylglycerophosphate synthase